jgi:hypothetical protein
VPWNGDVFSVRVEYLYAAVYWIGNVHFVVDRIDRDRSKAFELSIATSLASQTRKDMTIGAKLHDSTATRIDEINRIIGANCHLSRPVEAGRPSSDESPVTSELLPEAIVAAFLLRPVKLIPTALLDNFAARAV